MKKIRVNFTDFWPTFNKTDNYFYKLLTQEYEVIIDESNPDLLFFSGYGNEYLNFKCKRVFFTGENERPDFSACDFAFSFDYNSRKNHYRLPLYSIYIDYHNMLGQLLKRKTREEAKIIWESKTKFCCMVVSNPNSRKRLDFFENLNAIKKVDSGGKVYNNIGERVVDKYEFIKDYKFVISFENSSYNGYTTEKILEPIYKDCIPIYWGDPFVYKDFNSKRYIDYNDFESEDKLISKLKEIDENDELAIDMIMQTPFSEGKGGHEQEKVEVLTILIKLIESSKKVKAIGFWSNIHYLKLKYNEFQNKFLDIKRRGSKKIKLSFSKFKFIRLLKNN
jgi:hypothetical protein